MAYTSVNLDGITTTTTTDREWSADFIEGVLEWGGKGSSNDDCDGSTRLYSEERQGGGSAMGLPFRYMELVVFIISILHYFTD